jgi:hypothetical protein
MANFKSSFQGRLFTLKFLKNSTLAVCIARDGNVENEAKLDIKFKGNHYMFLFHLNVVFTTNFLKMVPIRVRFSPGFPPGAGLHGEEFALACF